MIVPTLSIMAALKTKIEAIIEPEVDPVHPLFQEVRAYPQANIGQAIDDLLIFEDRVCLIIPAGNRHNTQRIGDKLRVQRVSDFIFLLADRVYGAFDAEAMMGSPENPGTIRLQDYLLAALTGEQLGNPRLLLEPRDGQPFEVRKTDSAAAGRECWEQNFTTPAGYAQYTIYELTNQRSGD